MMRITRMPRSHTTDAVGLDRFARCAPATDNLRELAAWLRDNGPAHLSAIERIELAERLITCRRFLIGVGALVLAGCGAPGASAPIATPATPATRVVEGANGPIEIPAQPQRVVALADLINGYALASLGFDKLVAIGSSGESDPLARLKAYGPLPDGVPNADIGAWTEPNIEAVAALDPDLIIGTDSNHAPIYEQLSRIAPTVLVPESISFDNQVPFAGQRFVARMVGLEAALDARLAAYQARLGALQGTLQAQLNGVRYTWIDVYGPNDVYVSRTTVAPGSLVLRDLGAVRSPTTDQHAFGETPWPQISVELIPSVDADVIFVGYGLLPEENQANTVQLDQLLAATTAGKADQVFRVRYEAWGFPLAEGLFIVLDDLETMLANRTLTRSGNFG